jgi:hypothetical protein
LHNVEKIDTGWLQEKSNEMYNTISPRLLALEWRKRLLNFEKFVNLEKIGALPFKMESFLGSVFWRYWTDDRQIMIYGKDFKDVISPLKMFIKNMDNIVKLPGYTGSNPGIDHIWGPDDTKQYWIAMFMMLKDLQNTIPR